MHKSWKYGSESQAGINKKIIASRSLAKSLKSGSGSRDPNNHFLVKGLIGTCLLPGLWPNLESLALEGKVLKLMFRVWELMRKR